MTTPLKNLLVTERIHILLKVAMPSTISADELPLMIGYPSNVSVMSLGFSSAVYNAKFKAMPETTITDKLP